MGITPTGPLGFRWPQGINISFKGSRDVQAMDTVACNTKEASPCPTTVSLRTPSGLKGQQRVRNCPSWCGYLAVVSTQDQRPIHNTIFGIVGANRDMGLAISIDHWLGMSGLLQTPQVLLEGSSNACFPNQRLALRWVQEDIAAFGRDPRKAVIWGERCGAQSIAYHLFSQGGRDDGLYRGAILESRWPVLDGVPKSAHS